VSYGGSYGGGNGRGFRGPPGPKLVEVGKEYEVEVTEISRQGDGICKSPGFCSICKKRKSQAKS